MNNPLVEQALSIPTFESAVENEAYLHAENALSTFQLNLGRLCNLSCKHCHMEAGPGRTEIMNRQVMEGCLQVLRENDFQTVDITGGAPEMNPDFRWLAREAKELCPQVIVRTNLVILLEPGYEDLPEFYRDLGLEVFCSLPHYTPAGTDRMRGLEVFDKSIAALQRLNALGYGKAEGLALNLVYNPAGAFLPPSQEALEKEYRAKLSVEHGVVFNNLLAIANNPVGRFGEFLDRSGNLEGYLDKLYQSFNAGTLPNMMCRRQISVAYDGTLYDCDFNQALDMPIESKETIFQWVGNPIESRRICFGKHCFACTAGQGSSCGGATA